MISVFLHWNDRRRSTPQSAEETPAYTVHSIEDLTALIDRLD